MKLTAVLLTVSFLHVRADGISQTITLSVKNLPLENVISSIKQQSGYSFFYTMDIWKEAKPVTIDIKNATIDEVMKLVMRTQPFTYIIENKTIIISKKKEELKQENSLAPQSKLIDIRGRVLNEKGEPVLASITVKGSTKGTATNKDGWFVLAGIEENAILIISGVGIETTEVNADGKTQLEIAVKISVRPLDEVQMIAYGNTTRRLSTGNIGSVKSDEIQKQPVNNALLAIAGRVPGVTIIQSSGTPGTGVSVRIQGQNSLQRGNDPLYVVDGVPYISQLLPSINSAGILGISGTTFGSQQGNPLSYLNPADIESIEILKDAGSTSIYGSRAANGVVLITTKKGKAGDAKVDVDFKTGWGKVAKKLDVLNSQQYLEMRREAIMNDNATVSPYDYDLNGTWDTTRYTDWQKELIGGTAKYTTVQLNISGGSANTQYLVGAGYHKETTVFPGDFNDQKASLHFNIKSTSNNKRFNFLLTGNFLADNNQLIQEDLTSQAVSISPVAPALYNKDGTLNWAHDSTGFTTWLAGPVGGNPLSSLELKYNNRTNNLIGSSLLSYEIVKGLEIKTSLGYTNIQTSEFTANPNTYADPAFWPILGNDFRTARYGNGSIISWILEPHVTYSTTVGGGKLVTLLGSTFQQNNTNLSQYIGTGYNSDLVLGDPKSASQITVGNTIASKYKYNAFFGRLHYDLLQKYILDLTARRDGSSRFGSENQYHNFGSIAAGWIFSQEKIIQKNLPILSFGKLKASYGTTGNDLIGDYTYLNLYSVTPNVDIPYQGASGLQPTSLPNPYLQWEETKKLQIGLDVGFVKDRILLELNYFNNRSSNQLLPYSLPIITGFGSVTKNFEATVQNSGWEFSLSTVNIKTKDFSWTSNFNLTVSKNKLISFPNLDSSSYKTTYYLGKPINLVRAYHFMGVDQTTGIYQFLDSHGNPTTSPNSLNDRTALINDKFPDYYGGLENSFRYKGFELDILFQFVKQIGANYLFGTFPGSFYINQPTSVLSRWQKPGDNSSIQKYNSDYSLFNSNQNAYSSDAAYSNASYIRLKNASISWQVSEAWIKKVHLRSFKIYLQGQNLATITNYIGLDPETKSSRTLPPLRVVVVGAQFTL